MNNKFGMFEKEAVSGDDVYIHFSLAFGYLDDQSNDSTNLCDAIMMAKLSQVEPAYITEIMNKQKENVGTSDTKRNVAELIRLRDEMRQKYNGCEQGGQVSPKKSVIEEVTEFMARPKRNDEIGDFIKEFAFDRAPV